MKFTRAKRPKKLCQKDLENTTPKGLEKVRNCLNPYKNKIGLSPYLYLLRGEGLEPSSRKACAPQTHAYTNSAIRAKICFTTRDTTPLFY